MPSTSPKQQRFFQAVKHAKHDPSYGDARIRKVADSMTDKDIDAFAGSIAELRLKKALLGILKDSRDPLLDEDTGVDPKMNPIAKEFHVKDDFDQYIKKYIGQPLSPKEMEAISTFKEVKPSRVERTEIWYENTDEFKNSTTTVVKKMKDGNQFSFNAFTKHSSANPEDQQADQQVDQTPPAPTAPGQTPAAPAVPEAGTEQPMEEQKDDIVVAKSPLFKDEIEGGAILVEFLKKLDL